MKDHSGGLPPRVADIDLIRILKAEGTRCTCVTPRLLLKEDTRTVYCRNCGAQMDAYDALKKLALHWDEVNRQQQRLLEERQALLNWQPWRLAARELVDTMTKKGTQNLIPVCPHCGEGIEYQDLIGARYVDRNRMKGHSPDSENPGESSVGDRSSS
ncbi:hypothetical protein [Sulfobacillus thermosulfidooxidans]|uniref:hypothetical protein n=1 Tax=Sulfobacillus thermosulfidooxidans TaxID=28034 RepID=UPI0006B6089D|nr:hypothetical protein [Sulfobacillus thermosulfidooxidans]